MIHGVNLLIISYCFHPFWLFERDREDQGCLSMGYCFIGIALVSGLNTDLKVMFAALGSLLAGYSSVSLLDNITCMACSISFPQNRAAVVGYLKAVLATAGGLWALLWVQAGEKTLTTSTNIDVDFLVQNQFKS